MRPFLPFAMRDVCVMLVMAVMWWLDHGARERGDEGMLPFLIAVSAGVLTTLGGFFAHEWGHLAAAVASGGVVHRPRRLWSPFLFNFDTVQSDRRSFMAMSYGGYAASLVALFVIVVMVPWSAVSGRVSLVLSGLGVLVTFVVEVPTTVRVARGGPLPTGGVYRGRK